MLGYAAEGFVGPGFLPDAFIEGGSITRPILAAGGAPLPAVVLLTMTARSPVATLGSPITLVTADGLGADVTVTRAHTPSTAYSGELRADGVYQIVGQNLPRYGYLDRYLRVYAGRTNLLANPRTPGGAGWTNTGISGVTGVTGPDNGGTSGQRLTEDTGTTAHRTDHAAVSYVAGTSYSFAALVRAGSRDAIQLLFPSGAFSATTWGNFDLTNGVTGNAGAGLSRQAISGPFGGYYLCEIAATASTTATVGPVLFMVTSAAAGRAPTYTGASGTIDVSWVWCEEGAFAGPPILPQSGLPSATTRATDVPIWAPAALPRRGAIVLRCKVDALPASGYAGLLQLDDGTDSNRVAMRIPPGGQPECIVVSGGVTTAALGPAGVLPAVDEFAALLAWSPGGIRFGTSIGGVASAAVACPSGLLRALLGHANAAGTLPLGGVLVGDRYDWWPSATEAAAMLVA